VFDKFPKYHMKMLLEDFKAKVHRVDIFKPTTGNESIFKISNDNDRITSVVVMYYVLLLNLSLLL
jgi:hypothetical protein